MYNIKIIIIAYLIFLGIIYYTFLKGVLSKNIKYELLKILPLTLIFDIPLSSLHTTGKSAIDLRVWNFYIFLMIILYFKESISFIKKYRKYLLIIYFFMMFQLILNSFDIAMIRGYSKYIFSYLPLIIVTKIYIDKVSKEKLYRMLNIAGMLLGILSIVQIVAFKMHINLYIIELFRKPSGVFSEPIWLGIYMLFLIIILDKNYKKQKIFFFIIMILNGSKAAILMFIIVNILTMKSMSKKVGIAILGIMGIIAGIYLNLYSIPNIVSSFYIHSFNWIIPTYVFLKLNIFQILFGVGPGNINAMAHTVNIDTIRQVFDVSKSINLSDTIATMSSLGGDVANIWIEILTSFGFVALIGWIVIFIQMYRDSKKYKKSKQVLLAWVLVGTVHPLYYMGFGIFMIMIWKKVSERKEVGI